MPVPAQGMYVIISSVMGVVGLILSVVGESTNYWVTGMYSESSVNKGLFDCSEPACSGLMRTSQAITVMGILVCAIGVGIHVAFLWKNYSTTVLLKNGSLIILVGALCIFSGAVVYASEYRFMLPQANFIRLGWSFGLTNAGGVVMLMAAALAVLREHCIFSQ